MHGLTGGDWKRAAISGTAPVPDPPNSCCELGGAGGDVICSVRHERSRLVIMCCVTRTESKAAAAARIGAGLALRKRAELLGLLRPCFVRAEPWLQAGKYVSALVSELPKRNGWTIAEHAGDRTPDRTQRLLNRA